MAVVTVTAFQIGGFQFTGFQEAGGLAGGGDFPWFWMEMLSRWRAKREIEQKKKKKREEEEAEETFAQEMTTLRFVPITPRPAQPQPRALLKLLTRQPLIDEALELAEFKEFMAFAELAQAALAKRPTVRRLAAAKPAHELPGLTEAGDRMVAVLTEFFKAQAPKIAHQIEQLKARLWKAEMSDDEIAALNAVVAGIDFAGWATLAGDVDDIIGEVTRDGAYAALKLAGLDVTADKDVFNMVNEDALDYAEKRSAELVGMRRTKAGKLVENPDAEWQITEGTRDLIRGTVGDALQGGWSTADLADKLVQSAGFNADRAETIARTELIRAHNTGTLNGFKSSGVVALKEWTTFDPCPICEANEDQGPIGLDEAFDSGDDAPPAHPNCKCALVGYSDLAVSDLQAEPEEE